MFKINNKDTRTTPVTTFNRCHLSLFLFFLKKNILKSKLYSDKNNVISLSFCVHTTLYLFALGHF